MKRICIILITSGSFFFCLNWLLSKEMNIIDHFTSDYVHTKIGILTTLGFVFVGSGILLSSDIFNAKIPSFEINIFIYSLLFISLAIFPTDKIGENSLTGVIHKIIAAVCFLYFLVFLTIYLFRDGSSVFFPVLLLDVLSFVSLILMGSHISGLEGIFQRVYIFSQVLIVILLLMNNKLLGNGL